MITGTLNIKLRPLKLAFLVDPDDTKGLLEAIQASTFLWCGTFNPIIPVFKRTPKVWRDRFTRAAAKSIAEGTLQAFDPDYVVLTGRYRQPTIDVGHRKVLQSSEILEGVEEDGTPKYGIGLFELLQHFVEKELKFTRRAPLDILLPEFGKRTPLFLAAVFGSLPHNIDKVFRGRFEPALQAQRLTCTLANYAHFLKRENLFLRRLNTLYVTALRANPWLHGNCVFYLDATNPLDVVDYWNLRALGWAVLPVAKQAAGAPELKDHVRMFIEEHFHPLRGNPNIFSHTTVLKARSISEEELRRFGESLAIPPPQQPGAFKVSYQHWYPRMWDEWARDTDGAESCELEARSRSESLSGEGRTEFRTLDPKFAFRFAGNAEARFGNAVELTVYGNGDLIAEVIPEGDDSLARAIGALWPGDWRFGRDGPVYLARHLNWSVHLSLPKAEDVFAAWLRSKGWSVELSAPGLIAKQMIKQLGHGAWGISLLGNEGVVELLSDMSDGKPIEAEALWGRVQKIANASRLCKDPSGLLERLTGTQMFRLGLEVQCPICTQRSWYSIKDADYEVQCQRCLERFAVPSHCPKDMKWSYRTIGPFSLPGKSYGVYSVLLTLRFFSSLLHEPTTPILSFNAEKAGEKMEADLGLFLKEMRFGRSTIELVFAECKTYGRFEPMDIRRMLFIGQNFPGAVLVFATLRKELSDGEKRLLRPVVNRGRRYWKAERPFNPVLLLTGTELFSEWRPEQSWADAGGMHAAFAARVHGHLSLLELCDASQQLYLGMKPWRAWLQETWERRRQKRVPQPQMTP
jgi:hypothetical protein